MEFFIKKGATLPLLKLNIVDNGRNDYNNFLNTLELSSLFFSMTNVDTGIPKILNKPAGVGGTSPNYFIYYQFQNSDTVREGRFEGEFIIKNNDGTSILTLGEKLYINVTESFVLNDLDYATCYITDYSCCTKKKPVPIPSVTPSITPTMSLTPTMTPTPSVTDSSLLLILDSNIGPGSVVVNYTLTSSRSFSEEFTLSFVNLLNVNIGDGLAISTGVTINAGEYTGSTQVILPDNFNDLNRTSEYFALSINLTGLTYNVTYIENSIFQTPTNTPTISVTPSITPTPSSTQTAALPFRFTIDSTPQSFELPYSPAGIYSGTIDWGDGTIVTNSYDNRQHTYSSTLNPTWTITIDGTIEGWDFNTYQTSRNDIIEIISWGTLRGENNSNFGMFGSCSNLILTGVTDVLNLVGITSTTVMFYGCTSITSVNNMNNWDVSSVINMASMFYNCSSFNQNIGSWNVSNVTNMVSLFESASLFDQNLGNWDVSNVTAMSDMFYSTSFNNGNSPSISGWTTSACTNMFEMFANSQFNQPIGSWDVSNVLDVNNMLDNTPMSQTNYDNLLIGWSGLTLSNGLTFGVNGLLYSDTPCLAYYARNYISTTYGWTFNGDGSGYCQLTTPTPTPTPTTLP